jgi:hypothetical protein
MNNLAGPISQFPESCYISIWLNAFLTRVESLERIHDALAPKINKIEFGAINFDLFHFLEFLNTEKIKKTRVHLPVSGDLDGIIDTGEYLDNALNLSQVVSLIGEKSFALTGTALSYKLEQLSKPPKSPVIGWKEVDRLFAEFLASISESLEAFDLIAADEAAREWMIRLDHDISKLEFPAQQPARVTFLLGRLARTLTIGQLAQKSSSWPISATKNSMLQNQVEELITKSRQYLSQVSNYHWEQP